ncbi:MAG: hypothetical protein ACTS22_03615 [Phycisphaerales bacterium]
MPASFDALTHGLIDYAGLFPPASLGMSESCSAYARHLQSQDARRLSHFVCPASRLDELSKHGAALMPGTFATSGYREMANASEPWRIAAILAPDHLEQGIDMVAAFNRRHSEEERGLARVDTVEVRAADTAFIDAALETLYDHIFPYFEIDHAEDPRGMIAALSGQNAAAKLRCGTTEADGMPTSDQVSRFIHACALADVPMKCTAGLHHPIRGTYRLTYDEVPPMGEMHGFVNVFLAAAMVQARKLSHEQTVRLLDETDPARLSFADHEAVWRSPDGEIRVSADEITRSRQRLALSYGSCSFDEPVNESRALGWL